MILIFFIMISSFFALPMTLVASSPPLSFMFPKYMAPWTKLPSIKLRSSFVIFGLSNSLKMIRVYAPPIHTEMIYMKPFWNRPLRYFIRNAMGKERLIVKSKFTIPTRSRPGPFPAGVKRNKFDKFIKSFFWHNHIYFISKLRHGVNIEV